MNVTTKVLGKFFISTGCLFSSMTLLFPSWSSASVEVRLSKFGQTTHLEFQGQEQWVYNVDKKIEKKKTRFSIQVPQLSDRSVLELQKLRIPGVEKIAILKGPDQSQVVELTFAGERIDHFDYLTDRPSRLVVDFFPKATDEKTGKSANATDSDSEANIDSAEKKPTVLPLKLSKRTQASKDRKPATTDVLVVKQNEQAPPAAAVPEKAEDATGSHLKAGIFDGADPDFSRFLIKDYEIKEESIIASKQNVYVDFPILRLKPDEMAILESRMPVYNIQPKESEENKQARLLLTLFQKKRLNVFLKTVDWFVEKYPKSEYAETIDFMWADAYFMMWRQTGVPGDLDLAVVKYQEAIRRHPESALADRTSLFIAYARMERGDNLGALQFFQSYLNQYPKSENRDLALIAMAEANYNLNRYDDALKIYDQVIANPLRDQEKIRAAMLKGDVYFKKKDDAKAVEEYRKAIAQYPTSSEDYPNAYFNLASALFRLGRFKESLSAQVEFVKRFPSHPFSGYAMTRVGELLEILGADPARVIGAHLETYFRYGDTEGALVARLRLLSARMKAMRSKELDKAVRDIMTMADSSTLPKIEQFASVMIADGYHRRGEFEKSNALLIKYYQDHPTSADTELLNQRIVRNFSDQIHDYIEKGEFLSALKVHQKHAGDWLKGSKRIDLKYNLGRGFEQAGVFAEAEKMYRDSLNRLLALKGTQAEKETGVFERVPATDELFLRMAAVNVARGQFQLAIQNLKNIEKPDQLREVEQVERVILASQLYEKKGEPETAVRYLTELVKAWRGIPSLVAEPYLRLGEMESKLGRKESAIASLNRVDELMQDSGQVAEDTHLKALEKMAELQMDLQKPDAAAVTYQRILDQYEKKRPLASLRYRLGKIYFDKGELKKAAETWKNFENDKQGFWAKLAGENLKNSEWNEDYKKYLKRIPAMSDRSPAAAAKENKQ